MVGLVLTSHGGLAEGIKNSGQMLFGPQDEVAAVSLTPDMGPDDLRKRLLEAVQGFKDPKQVLFLVDLQGGTPWNQVNTLLAEEGHETWAALAGLNLPMLISAYAGRTDTESAQQLAQDIYVDSMTGIVIKPDSLAPRENRQPEQAAAAGSVSQLAPGTVLGDGHIKTALVRIDSRLLHGQVATAWSKQVRPTRIIVVSDGVAHNAMRKALITEAAPPGVRANVIPVQKLIDIWDDPRMGSTRALFLFENPQDVERALEGGVDFKEVNVGSMAHSEGKTMLSDAVSVNANDVAAIRAILDHGVKMTVQKVPTDKAADLWSLVVKAGMDK